MYDLEDLKNNSLIYPYSSLGTSDIFQGCKVHLYMTYMIYLIHITAIIDMIYIVPVPRVWTLAFVFRHPSANDGSPHNRRLHDTGADHSRKQGAQSNSAMSMPTQPHPSALHVHSYSRCLRRTQLGSPRPITCPLRRTHAG